ncbi:hypothetical protein E2C01_038157 [Portunus trituberculatus]|uniref:Uncharacterized protein n=1 Tax=Portunus trituberculatus TaxID=210409 RepID=A0A5B7FJ67_PORTR|nr:hypothetical protein [Portunus trituberculatus]
MKVNLRDTEPPCSSSAPGRAFKDTSPQHFAFPRLLSLNTSAGINVYPPILEGGWAAQTDGDQRPTSDGESDYKTKFERVAQHARVIHCLTATHTPSRNMCSVNMLEYVLKQKFHHLHGLKTQRLMVYGTRTSTCNRVKRYFQARQNIIPQRHSQVTSTGPDSRHGPARRLIACRDTHATRRWNNALFFKKNTSLNALYITET